MKRVMSGMPSPVIEARGLVKTFTVRGKEIPVLRGLDIAVAPGEIVTVRGKSGAGKSVLLWLLSGLDRPTGGDVYFEGQPMAMFSNAATAYLRRHKIGVIFQNFNLVASWTACENVAAALEGDGYKAEEAKQKASAILSELGLGERLNNLPAELSVGQQQRVAVARTLAGEPSLILADEPTGAVDPETADEIVQMLLKPVRERGAALVVTTHGHFPEHIANRLFKLQDGKLVAGSLTV